MYQLQPRAGSTYSRNRPGIDSRGVRANNIQTARIEYVAQYDRRMQFLVAMVLVLVPLGGPFVEANASAERVDDTIEVELTVEVNQSATAVIAHIIVGGDEPQRSVSLDLRAGGVFGGFVTLPLQESVIVFELLGTGGSVLSAPTTLSKLGVDFAAFGASVTPLDEDVAVDPITPEARRWLWLAVGAGAAALSALAFWAITGNGDRAQSEEDEFDRDESAEEPSVDDV